MSGRQNFLLLQKDMAEVGGPPCEGFDANFNIPCPLPRTFVFHYCFLCYRYNMKNCGYITKYLIMYLYLNKYIYIYM